MLSLLVTFKRLLTFPSQHTTAQPPIEAFLPTKDYTGKVDASIELLNDCIEKIDVPGAINVYQTLLGKETQIPDAVKQNLLELVAFFNAAKPLADDAHEEQDFVRSSARQRDAQPLRWKTSGFADRIFNSIESKTPAAYNTMIRALVKYNQAETSKALFEEMLEKGMPIDTETFNAVIIGQVQGSVSPEERWVEMEKLLKLMSERHVAPNAKTLYAALVVIQNGIGGGSRNQREKALQILAEFKSLGIEPSIGSWAIVMKIFCKERGPPSHILVDILDHLGETELPYQDQSDAEFFMTAMNLCNFHLQDFQLAQRVDRLLNIGHNRRLVGDSFSQRAYYRYYLQLAVKALPLNEFIELYDQIVPSVHSIEINLCDIIIGKINESGAIELTPKFWSDMLIGGLISHRCSKTIELFLDVMCDNPPQDDLPAHENLNERFGECAWNYWERLSNEVAMDRVTNLSAVTLGKILLLCCRHKKFDRASEVVNAILVGSRKSLVTGAIPYEPIKAFVELCVGEQQSAQALNCLAYAVEHGLEESGELGKLIGDEFVLGERETRRLINLVGKNELTEKQRL